MDRHGAYVALSRHQSSLALHYRRDDFQDQSKLVRTLSRDRGKDMASDYPKLDPTRDYAERRGISFGERVAEIIRKVPEKARGMFDSFRPNTIPQQGIDRFEGFRPAAPSRQYKIEVQPSPAGGQRGAVERYARAFDEIERMRSSGLAPMPHQTVALERARETLDAIRPHAAADLGAAFRRSPELVREAAEGRSQAAIRAMQLEAEIRTDPFQRADRFVEGWKQLQQHHADLVRDGNFRGAKTAAQQMVGMAKSLERDAQLESILRPRSRDLGLERSESIARSLSRDLAASIPHEHVRGISRGMSR